MPSNLFIPGNQRLFLNRVSAQQLRDQKHLSAPLISIAACNRLLTDFFTSQTYRMIQVFEDFYVTLSYSFYLIEVPVYH